MPITIQFAPLPFPPSIDKSRLGDFGREVIGIHPASLDDETFPAIERALYKYDALLFRNVDLTPEEQYALVRCISTPLHANRAITPGISRDSTQRRRATATVTTKSTMPKPTSYTPTSTASRAHLKSRSSGTAQSTTTKASRR
ncbi:hypothetical protein BDZ89DRAFT_79872 [Hymenopellis radicata]|nr:hypothetical protein BDZ89DRAFT_79872 [Hymenopellis radicata]